MTPETVPQVVEAMRERARHYEKRSSAYDAKHVMGTEATLAIFSDELSAWADRLASALGVET